MTPVPKYALMEIERRMLVLPERLPDLHGLACRYLEDRYLEAGRIRLRKVTGGDPPECLYKLGKKYGRISAYEEPVVNIYLTAEEYEILHELPGCELTKRRYLYRYLGHPFSIDVYTGPLTGLYLCETEAASVEELLGIVFPSFVIADVTTEASFSGASLARNRQIP